jgi:hypothetical protein
MSLGRARTLDLSEPVSASGYPLDVREWTPAAVTGEVARVGREGLLFLSMSVNPGNSGGPVIDAHGRLVGILTARGRPEEGIEGLAVAVPLAPILEAADRLPQTTRPITEGDRQAAAAVPLLVELETPPLEQIEQRAIALGRQTLARTDADPEADAIVASLGWNVLLRTAEQRGAGPSSELQQTVMRLADRALATGPHTRRHFPVLRAIRRGVLSTPAAQNSER